MAQPNQENNKLEYQYYGIEFKIVTDNLLSTKDIQSFTVIRAPLHKASTFAILNCVVDKDTYSQVEKYIRENKTVICEVIINKIDRNKSNGTVSGEKDIIKQLMKKTYYIDYCKAISPESKDSEFKQHQSVMPVINFFLVNPALWYLSNRKRYNLLTENKTAYETLEEIEKTLMSDYKDTFNFKDFRIGIEPNKYKYEHILVRSANDLIIPNTIVKSYKVIDQPSYYFFDDFYYSDTLTKNFIPVFFVNLTDPSKFRKIDISDNQWIDLSMYNLATSIMPITDRSNFFQNPDKVAHMLKIDSNNVKVFEFNKNKSKIPNYIGKNEKENEKSDYKRYQYSQEFTFQHEEKENANDLLKLYAPEKGSHNSAVTRYNICSEFYRNQVHAICTFKADKAFIDTIQFNRIYNLDLNNPDDYGHIPISIVNSFQKVNTTEMFYTHSVKYQTLQFKPTKADANNNLTI